MSNQKPSYGPFQSFGADMDYIHYVRPFNKSNNFNVFIFEGFRNPQENLYVGKIPDEALKLEHNDKFYRKVVTEFFTTTISEEVTSFTPSYLFAKWYDLTTIWFRDRGFKGLLGAHWNPRIKKVIVHPGGQRIKIVKMFPIYNYDFVFFNTNGYKPHWITKMKHIDIRRLEVDMNMSIGGITLDHGAAIPHPIWKGAYNIENEAEKARLDLENKVKDIKLYFKHNSLVNSIDFLNDIRTDTIDNADFIISINKGYEDRFWYNLTRILLVCFTDVEFKDNEIIIERNEK